MVVNNWLGRRPGLYKVGQRDEVVAGSGKQDDGGGGGGRRRRREEVSEGPSDLWGILRECGLAEAGNDSKRGTAAGIEIGDLEIWRFEADGMREGGGVGQRSVADGVHRIADFRLTSTM